MYLPSFLIAFGLSLSSLAIADVDIVDRTTRFSPAHLKLDGQVYKLRILNDDKEMFETGKGFTVQFKDVDDKNGFIDKLRSKYASESSVDKFFNKEAFKLFVQKATVVYDIVMIDNNPGLKDYNVIAVGLCQNEMTELWQMMFLFDIGTFETLQVLNQVLFLGSKDNPSRLETMMHLDMTSAMQ